MKKLSLILAAALLAAALTACGTGSSSSASSAADSTPAAESTPSPLPESSEAQGSDADQAEPETSTPDEALSGIVNEIYAKAPIELMMVETMAVDLENEDWLRYNLGLTADDAKLIDAAVLSESMTGSSAYSLALVRVKDAADADAVAQTMIDTIDPAKWICVMADQQQCNVYGDVVVYCMADSNVVDIAPIMNAATELLGEPTASHTAKAQ